MLLQSVWKMYTSKICPPVAVTSAGLGGAGGFGFSFSENSIWQLNSVLLQSEWKMYTSKICLPVAVTSADLGGAGGFGFPFSENSIWWLDFVLLHWIWWLKSMRWGDFLKISIPTAGASAALGKAGDFAFSPFKNPVRWSHLMTKFCFLLEYDIGSKQSYL